MFPRKKKKKWFCNCFVVRLLLPVILVFPSPILSGQSLFGPVFPNWLYHQFVCLKVQSRLVKGFLRHEVNTTVTLHIIECIDPGGKNVYIIRKLYTIATQIFILCAEKIFIRFGFKDNTGVTWSFSWVLNKSLFGNNFFEYFRCSVIWNAILLWKCWLCISIFTGSYKYNKTHIFIHSQATPTTSIHHPFGFCWAYMYFCTEFRSLNKSINQILGDILWVCWTRQRGLSSSLKDGCSTKRWGQSQPDHQPGQTSNPDKISSKTIGYF